MTATLVHATDSAPVANMETLREQIPDFAKDIRLNLGTVITSEGAPDLSQEQIFGIALATAYSIRSERLIAAVEGTAATIVGPAVMQAAKAAASVMAMNNVYYRFIHLVHDAELSKLPAKLRMNIIANPGIAKVDFELMSLAVSAVNGCGMCMEAHVHEVTKAGVSKTGIQSAVRIAATLNAAAQALAIA